MGDSKTGSLQLFTQKRKRSSEKTTPGCVWEIGQWRKGKGKRRDYRECRLLRKCGGMKGENAGTRNVDKFRQRERNEEEPGGSEPKHRTNILSAKSGQQSIRVKNSSKGRRGGLSLGGC